MFNTIRQRSDMYQEINRLFYTQGYEEYISEDKVNLDDFFNGKSDREVFTTLQNIVLFNLGQPEFDEDGRLKRG